MTGPIVHVPVEATKWTRTRQWVRLADLCEIFDCPHSTPPLSDEGPFLARSQDIRSEYFAAEDAAHVSEKTYLARIARAEPRFGDLLYSREGTYFGIAAEVPADLHVCLGQRMVLIRPNPDKVNFRFLRYWLNSPTLTAHIHGFRDGSVAERLNMPTIFNLPIPVFSLQEQREIAETLGVLDDKITLYREMNSTLEEIVRTTFEAWCIKFEPVKMKEAGASQYHGMPQQIFDSLSDNLVNGKLGPIPGDWGVVPLDEVVDINPYRPMKRGALAPYLPMAAMPTNGHAPEYWEVREFGSGMRFSNGDTLLARITPCLENGKTAYIDFLSDGQIGWGSTEYIVLRPRGTLTPIYAYCLARSTGFRDYAIKNMTGTSGRQRVSAQSIAAFKVVKLPPLLSDGFGALAEPLFNKVAQNQHESRLLQETRDFLLPRLLSGKSVIAEWDGQPDETP